MAQPRRMGRIRSARARRRSASRRARARPEAPPLYFVRAPGGPITNARMGLEITVATYNVHRWTGHNGRRLPDPARAAFVISEIGADVIGLQEVLRPSNGEDPLGELADALGLYTVFGATRMHKRGELGNAILSRFPVAGVSVLDLSFSRLERRVAVAAQLDGETGGLVAVATHLALVDRTRQRQVKSLLEHPQLQSDPSILLGDMNAWRRCKATRTLNEQLRAHHNEEWPASFPAARPVLALDRIYASGVKVRNLYAHDTPAARRASDHLPIVAEIELPNPR